MVLLSEADLRSISKTFRTIVSGTGPGTGSPSDQELENLRLLLGQLFDSAEAVQLTASHRAAACNALCGFIDTVTGSSILQVKSISLNCFDRILSFYLERFSDASARSMQQVLNTLINLIVDNRNIAGGNDVSKNWTEDVARLCLDNIYSSKDFTSMKPSMLLLEAVLSKRVIGRDEFNRFLFSIVFPQASSTSVPEPDQAIRSASQNFTRKVLRLSRNPDISLAAGRLLRTMFKNNQDTSDKTDKDITDEEPVWLQPILDVIEIPSTDLERLEKNILSELLSADQTGLLHLARKLPIQQVISGTHGQVTEPEIRVILLLVDIIESMKLTPKLKLSLRLELRTPLENLRNIIVMQCIQHQSPSVRTAAAGQLISSNGSAAVFTEQQLQALKPVFRAFFVEADPKVRGEVTNIIKKLTARLLLVVNRLRKGSSSVQIGENAKEYIPELDQTCLYQHLDFINWFQQFLSTELRPSASYQRHIMALKSLNMGSTLELFSACQITVFTPPMIRQIAELVLDAFDDVRSSAADLLQKQKTLDGNIINPDRMESCISIAKDRMTRTGRASLSDGYARFVGLSFHFRSRGEPATFRHYTLQLIVTDIQSSLQQAKLNLQKAVANSQLHGHFTALRYAIGQPLNGTSFSNDHDDTDWRAFHDSLFRCCQEAWEIVQPVLCIDSPEGQGDEDDVQDLDIGIKDTLSFSWRTLKEASSLMQATMSSPHYGRTKGAALEHKDYSDMGDLAFLQLSELRHRGAFSTVAQCFTACCIECGKSSDKETKELPRRWYQETLENITAKASALTRRSAGLPALMTGILASDSTGPLFDLAMTDLQNIALEPTTSAHEHGKTGLPQVHAMNCIKEIFANSRLGTRAETYLEGCLSIALSSLRHEIFSIRNCGGMLLNAILNRLNNCANTDTHSDEGEQRHRTKGIYKRFPTISTAIESLLQACLPTAVSGAEMNVELQINVGISAFDLMDRVGVRSDSTETIAGMLYVLLGNPVWTLRERAAIALARLVESNCLIKNLYESIDVDIADKCLESNLLHGRLLCLKLALQNKNTETYAYNSALACMMRSSYIIVERQCPFTTNAVFEVLNVIYGNEPKHDNILVGDEELCSYVAGFPESLTDIHFLPDPSYYRLTFLRHLWLYHYDESHLNHPELGDSIPSIRAVLEILIERPKLIWICDLYLEHWIGQLVDGLAKGKEHDDMLLSTVQLMVLVLQHDASVKVWEELLADQYGERDPSEWFRIADAELFSAAAKNPTSAYIISHFRATLASFSPQKPMWGHWKTELRRFMSRDHEPEERVAYMKCVYSGRVQVRASFYANTSNRRNHLPRRTLLSLLYENLHDDDGQVRDLTAATVSYILSEGLPECSVPSCVAMASQDLLLDYIKANEMESKFFHDLALRRILGSPIEYGKQSSMSNNRTQMLVISEWGKDGNSIASLYKSLCKQAGPVVNAIREVLYEDNTLFEEERQNLYKDDVQEMEDWAGVLVLMKRPYEAISPIYDWAIYGLEMVERSEGSPGWTYRREGFEAVCKVLIFAKVVQAWSKSIYYQEKLYDAVLRVESKLAIAHPDHTRLIEDLKNGFAGMNLDELEEEVVQGKEGER